MRAKRNFTGNIKGFLANRPAGIKCSGKSAFNRAGRCSGLAESSLRNGTYSQPPAYADACLQPVLGNHVAHTVCERVAVGEGASASDDAYRDYGLRQNVGQSIASVLKLANK